MAEIPTITGNESFMSAIQSKMTTEQYGRAVQAINASPTLRAQLLKESLNN